MFFAVLLDLLGLVAAVVVAVLNATSRKLLRAAGNLASAVRSNLWPVNFG